MSLTEMNLKEVIEEIHEPATLIKRKDWHYVLNFTGINNDEELAKAVDDDENGWELINNRWYELMVFEESDGRRQEISDGSDLDFADNQEGFEEWINNAIEDWID